ncbi:enoyl-CoA hydratase-related protein [Rhizobium sp. L1K21]|nr:enoyl-CoA hydratase-related protein [Rhizobium sp. L1K21]
MRILLLCHSFNSLSQRLHVDLRELGHMVSVELDIHDDLTREAVALFQPDLIIAPFLKRAIPADVWQQVLTLIVHPGIRGDKGPNALDWAILDNESRWGVTLIEARAEMDAGPVWAWREFAMRPATKSSLYRQEVTEAAVACVLEALERMAAGNAEPLAARNDGSGVVRGAVPAACRMLDPQKMSAEEALTIIRASDGDPGAGLTVGDKTYRVFNACLAEDLSGAPGRLLGSDGRCVAVAFCEGALWIGHARESGKNRLKLPAANVFADCALLPKLDAPQNMTYTEARGVGIIRFNFYNGAMSVADCNALRQIVAAVRQRPLKVLVLIGSADCWSNGIHLSVIESANSPADESWSNINAMNDLVREIILAQDRIVLAGLTGNAGAGGVFLSLAADRVLMREGVILNPHYKDMGNLYGSEYWTYLLPMRVGEARARTVTQARLPMGIEEALRLGLASARLPRNPAAADAALLDYAFALAQNPAIDDIISEKAERRNRDEAAKPLAAYREEELVRMKKNFYGFDPSYHVARHNFIRKVPKSRTPVTLAIHRAMGADNRSTGGRTR